MEKITVIITYSAYVESIPQIDQQELEKDIKTQLENRLSFICVSPKGSNDWDDDIDFDLQDVTAATGIALATIWNVD